LLKYNPKIDAETYAGILESKNAEITPQIKEQLAKQYPPFTKATVTIQALIKTYLEQKNFVTVKPSLSSSRLEVRQEREKAAQSEISGNCL
jgi:hypothetical protein